MQSVYESAISIWISNQYLSQQSVFESAISIWISNHYESAISVWISIKITFWMSNCFCNSYFNHNHYFKWNNFAATFERNNLSVLIWINGNLADELVSDFVYDNANTQSLVKISALPSGWTLGDPPASCITCAKHRLILLNNISAT